MLHKEREMATKECNNCKEPVEYPDPKPGQVSVPPKYCDECERHWDMYNHYKAEAEYSLDCFRWRKK